MFSYVFSFLYVVVFETFLTVLYSSLQSKVSFSIMMTLLCFRPQREYFSTCDKSSKFHCYSSNALKVTWGGLQKQLSPSVPADLKKSGLT